MTEKAAPKKRTMWQDLFLVQKEIDGIVGMDSTNPHFRSKYVSLVKVISRVLHVVQKYNFVVMQTVEDGHMVTRLLHKSGEVYESKVQIVYAENAKNPPQAYGSALTYSRRYSLMTALGLAPADDDANGASNNQPQRATDSRTVAKEIIELKKQLGYDEPAMHAFVSLWFGEGKSFNDMTPTEKIQLRDQMIDEVNQKAQG
jgi:hypothetical protein